MRSSSILEALAATGMPNERILLVDCDDASCQSRLTDDRNQPDLANADKMNWARFLREEALAAGCTVLDTIGDCVKVVE